MGKKQGGVLPLILGASGIVAIFFLSVIADAIGVQAGWIAGGVLILVALYLWKGEWFFNKLFGGKGS